MWLGSTVIRLMSPVRLSGWGWPMMPVLGPRVCRVVGVVGSMWPWPSSVVRSCCSSMSPPPDSTQGPPRLLESRRGPAADGTTVLLTTHYLDEAAHLADEVAVVLGGSIAAQGAPEDLARGEGDLTVSWVEDGEERTERTTAPTAVVRGLMSRLAGPGEEVPGLRITAPTLEDRYLELVAAYEAAARRAALTAAA